MKYIKIIKILFVDILSSLIAFVISKKKITYLIKSDNLNLDYYIDILLNIRRKEKDKIIDSLSYKTIPTSKRVIGKYIEEMLLTTMGKNIIHNGVFVHGISSTHLEILQNIKKIDNNIKELLFLKVKMAIMNLFISSEKKEYMRIIVQNFMNDRLQIYLER